MTNQPTNELNLMRIRLDAQRRTLQMASLSQDDYRRILRLMQLLCDAECAWISLLGDEQDQLLEGLDIPAGLPPAIAKRVIAGEGLFECSSAEYDPQLRSHAWCSEHELGWLAAYPLHSPEGHPIGIVAVAAREPRSLDIRHRLALVDLVNLLEVEMRMRFLLATQPQALRKQMQSISLADQQGGAKLLEPREIGDLLHCSYTRCRRKNCPLPTPFVIPACCPKNPCPVRIWLAWVWPFTLWGPSTRPWPRTRASGTGWTSALIL